MLFTVIPRPVPFRHFTHLIFYKDNILSRNAEYNDGILNYDWDYQGNGELEIPSEEIMHIKVHDILDNFSFNILQHTNVDLDYKEFTFDWVTKINGLLYFRFSLLAEDYFEPAEIINLNTFFNEKVKNYKGVEFSNPDNVCFVFEYCYTGNGTIDDGYRESLSFVKNFYADIDLKLVDKYPSP